MKKTLLFIATLLLAVTVAFGLSSCDVGTYTVTFTVDGEVYHTATVTAGGNVQLPENPAKEGYKFTGWELEGEDVTADTVISDNVTIVATWEEVTDEGGNETDGNETDGNEHTHSLTHHDAVLSGCTADGNIEYWYCSGCKKYFSDANAGNEITNITVSKTGHTLTHYEETVTCTEDGHLEHWHCSVCKKYYSDAEATQEVASISATASHAYVGNECRRCGNLLSEGLLYELSEDETYYTVTGIGTCNDTKISIPWIYNNKPVTAIGTNAFSGCTSLTSIEIPNSVTSIDNYAFYNCTGLTSMTIPNSVTSIGYYAFYGCYKLVEVINKSNLNIVADYSSYGDVAYYAKEVHSGTSKIVKQNDYLFYTYNDVDYLLGYVGNEAELTLPENYNGENYEIYKYAFSGCDNLTSVTIGNSVESIGYSAFNRCVSLTNIDVDTNNTAYKSIEGSLYTKDGVTLVQYAIGKKDTSFIISADVTSIDDYAFYNCDNLLSVTIGNNVTDIGSYAFYSCSSLTSIEIPNGVTSIGASAFEWCDSLTSIEIPNSVTSIGDSVFQYCESITSVIIPDSVTSIGSEAFYGCDNLVSVTIGNSVKNIYQSAFFDCDKLVEIINKSSLNIVKGDRSYGFVAYYAKEVHNGASKIVKQNDYLFCTYNDVNYLLGYLGDETELTLPANYGGENYEIYKYAFSGYDSLTSVIIPDSVTSIGDYAFAYHRESLTSVTIGNGVKSIGIGAFDDCDSLASIRIPDSVTGIGSSAFYSCDSLASVTIGNNVTSIARNAFSGCYKLVEVINKSSLSIVAGNSSYGSVAYYAKEVHSGTSKIVKQNNYLFYTYNDVNYLLGYVGDETELTLPANYNGQNYEIYNFAFFNQIAGTDFGYSNIVSVTIPGSVTNIGIGAFRDCTSLTSVTIGSGVESISEDAFYKCSSLMSVTFEENSQLKSIGGFAFYYCTNLTSIEIPSSVTSIEEYAFSGCNNLIQTEKGIAYVDKWVIDCDTNVTSAELRQNTVGIADYAFYDCSSLTSVTIPNTVTSIGFYAFDSCRNLTSIEIPNSVISIGKWAFGSCTKLTSVTFENPNGWWYSWNPAATSGTSIPTTDLSNPETAATSLKSTYFGYYWKRT